MSDTITPIHPNILDQRESVPVSDFLTEYQWEGVDITPNWLDPRDRYVRPLYTLSYNGVPFAPLGGLHGLTGQPGHGKTMTFTQLMIALLKGEYYGLHYELSHLIPEPTVLYIDTEMEKGNTQLVMLRVYEMMGWEEGSIHDNFRILWLREEVKSEDRWRKVLKAIQVAKPTVVFLDGLIDVINDFNSNEECQQIIYACMATASHYNISFWCLLHENPGSTKMVGHAGSFLERKATDVLKTKKDKEGGVVSFTVSQNKARSRDLDEWKFTIEDDEKHYGHPVLQDGTFNHIEDKDAIQAERIKQVMLNIVWTMEGLRYSEIEKNLKAQGITSNRMISDYIVIAQQNGYIRKDERKKRYFIVYSEGATVDTQTPIEEEEEPF